MLSPRRPLPVLMLAPLLACAAGNDSKMGEPWPGSTSSGPESPLETGSTTDPRGDDVDLDPFETGSTTDPRGDDGDPSTSGSEGQSEDPTADDGGGTDDGRCTSRGCACRTDGQCDADLVCEDSSCSEAQTCGRDPNEPNDILTQAHRLPPISTNDATATSVQAIIGRNGDIDWYEYLGEDQNPYFVDPEAMIDGPGFEVCIVARCANGNDTNFRCFDELGNLDDPQRGPQGLPMCCSRGPEPVHGAVSCGWTNLHDDTSQIWMSVRSLERPTCRPYMLEYHF